MTSAEVVAQETARLRQKLGREPDGLELTAAITGEDEANEVAIGQLLWRSRGPRRVTLLFQLLPEDLPPDTNYIYIWEGIYYRRGFLEEQLETETEPARAVASKTARILE